ncbi:MAG: hypothetical protein HKP62_04820 [Sulfurovum sp.]|nr:hypothetical protein [Sulfurovum sp.]NNJ45320.1 hypothetical protein [Sulfurovum sp.]
MKKLLISILVLLVLLLSGCGGGVSTPSDDDNISVVKLTDLRSGYLVRGLLPADIGEDTLYSLEFCNDELTIRIEYYGDIIDDYYGVGTYEIIGEGILVYANGDAMIDTGDSGTFEEGKSYLIEQQAPNNLTWRIGSISKIECLVEPI